MDQPLEFFLKNVRCFHGEHRARLRPITLLVGENSTGKTTFLGCYRVLHDLLSPHRWPFADQMDFNQEPFSMGSFRDIVRSGRGTGDGINEFTLGITVGGGRKNKFSPYPILVTFSEAASQPVVSRVRYQFNSASFMEMSRDSSEGTILTIQNATEKINLPIECWFFVWDYLSRAASDPTEELQKIIEYLSETLSSYKSKRATSKRRSLILDLPQLIPLAPLRSKPKRTYDPIRETESADGEHIPMLMMRLNRTDELKWSSLHDDLIDFGRASGLFSDIGVRRHGKQISDPFQLKVKVRTGPRANIMDVGYGVSQSLPMLVDVRRARNHVFLLQQPEVHLHPRAQAELAELFVKSFRKQRNSFLIETHSDYIVDRVRMLVRRKAIDADNVSILYFDPNNPNEPKGNAVSIHSLTLDEDGNLQDAPTGYRDFFIRETDRLLGFAD